MIKKKLTKLVGLKKEDFDQYVRSGQIQVQPARLIPTLKTGDEMALTSILLSTIKLVKEYRDGIFKQIKLSRTGKVYYYTEASFPELDKSRLDGLILVVIKGIIADAAIFEMKNKNNSIDQSQIEGYISLAKTLKINKLITVSNQFVADPNHSPISVKLPKGMEMYHFSWTYLITKGQILLYKNDTNIEDEDQIEIMREALHYLESPVSGVSGYTQMNASWKELSDNIRAQKPLKTTEKYIEEAILSWYEEESDIALLLSRKLGVLVKSSSKGKEGLKNDIKKVVNDHTLHGTLTIKNSVSDIKIHIDFERRTISFSTKVIPPLDKGNAARVTFISKQLDNCRKKSEEVFDTLKENIWIDGNIKFNQNNLRVNISELSDLKDIDKGKEITAFHILLINSFGASFSSPKKFISLIEQLIVDYYEGIVQHLSNWNRPAPKIHGKEEVIAV